MKVQVVRSPTLQGLSHSKATLSSTTTSAPPLTAEHPTLVILTPQSGVRIPQTPRFTKLLNTSLFLVQLKHAIWWHTTIWKNQNY